MNGIKGKIRLGFSTLILLNILVAAVVGTVFGYLGAGLQNYSATNEPGVIQHFSVVKPVSSEEEAVINAVKKSNPAVVSIVASQDLVSAQQGGGRFFQNFCEDPFFRQFLSPLECDNTALLPQPQTHRQQVAAGTGFFVGTDGLIVTNKHVVNIDKADFTVLTNDGKEYPAKVLAKDPFHDLALVKIEPAHGRNFPVLFLGNSDTLQIGQSVIAIGNALGEFSNTVSRGVVSGLSRSIVAQAGASSEKLEKLIQTDAAINPGNSGGPLLNLHGEVVGINTAIAQGAQSVGFAIPVNQIKKAITDVKLQGRIVYPYIGVRYLVITPELKTARNLAVDYGVTISSDGKNPGIVPNSPAEKAGLKEGDIILEINGQKLTTDNDLSKVVQKSKVGEKITLKILRDGQSKTLEVVLEERK